MMHDLLSIMEYLFVSIFGLCVAFSAALAIMLSLASGEIRFSGLENTKISINQANIV